MSGESSVDGLNAKFANTLGIRVNPNVVTNAGDLGAFTDGTRYRMDFRSRGKFIVINNKTFDPRTGMNERTGTDVDASNLCRLFKKIGFDVERHDNIPARKMHQIMVDVGKQDHSECACFGVAVLSHGEQGILFGTDDTISIENFIQPIKNCLTLAGKPKLFFFQACRGSELDHGVEVESDADHEAPRNIARIPQEADFLFAYSTTPGYFSWRNSNKGSWFVQAIDRVLGDLWNKDVDLLRILTRVNHAVAYEFESNAAQAHMTRKKQVPSIVSQLTKDLYFTQK